MANKGEGSSDWGASYARLPEEIRAHIDVLAEGPDAPKLPDIRERIAVVWEGKFELFESQIKLLEMEELDALAPGDGRGFLAITYSGSILSVCSESASGRRMEYVPINLRLDVPKIASGDDARIKGAITRGSPIAFESGPIKSTSAVYRIAACSAALPVDEQDRRIREAAVYLTQGFIKMNRSLSADKTAGAEQFTLRGMAQYVARKNDVATVLVKQLLEDFFATAESGLILGERVSLGRLGSLSLKLRPARKARILKNPVTKEDVLVPAKPKMATPRMSFHKSLKDKAASAGLGSDSSEE